MGGGEAGRVRLGWGEVWVRVRMGLGWGTREAQGLWSRRNLTGAIKTEGRRCRSEEVSQSGGPWMVGREETMCRVRPGGR